MKKKLMAMLLVAAMALSLVACGSKEEAPADAPAAEGEAAEESTEPIELIFAHIFTSTGNETTWLEWASDEIEARTNGGLIINVFGDSQLGNESELTPQVISGDIAFSLSEGSVWGDALGMPELGIFGLPYICSTYEEMEKVGVEILPGVLNTMLEAKDANLVCLGAFSQGMRCVMTTEVAVRQASDLQGIKCRVPESSLYVDTMTALGTIPTPIPSSELYSALSSGIVAGYENDPATAVNRNLHEVLNYYSKTNHFAALNTMMIAKNVYESLPAEYQTILTEVMAEACKNQIQERAAQSDEFLKIMEEEGNMEIIDLDESVIEDLKALVAPMKEEFVKENGIEDIYNDLLAQLAE